MENFSRIQNAIDTIASVRATPDTGDNWYSHDTTPRKEEYTIIDTLDLLENLKQFEVEVSDSEIDYLLENYDKADNSYNWEAPISNHLEMKFCDDDIIVISVHICGDVRCNYTDYFVIRLDLCSFYEISMEAFDIAGKYTVDIDAFSCEHEVYDKEGNYILTTCEIEISRILEEVMEFLKEEA